MEIAKRNNFISWDEYFMLIAQVSTLRSKDPSTQVGSCIVNSDHRIIGIGYNGFPTGCCDDDFPWSRCGKEEETKYAYVVHAEVNAVLNTTTGSCRDCIVYTTMFPCNECAKILIQAGIRQIIYQEDKYHDDWKCITSRRMLDASGIKYRQYTTSYRVTNV